MGQIECICAIKFYKLIKIWSSKCHGVSYSWNSWLRPKRPNSGVAGPAKEPTFWKCDSKILRFMVNELRWVALLHFILFKTMERLHWDTAPMGMVSRTGGKPGKPQKLPKNLNADVESLRILLSIFDGRILSCHCQWNESSGPYTTKLLLSSDLTAVACQAAKK